MAQTYLLASFIEGLGAIAATALLYETALLRVNCYRKQLIAICAVFILGTLASMAFPYKLAEGVYFDLRHVFIIIASLFAGWQVAMATAIAAAIFRLWESDVATVAAVTGIFVSLGIGLAGARYFPVQNTFSRGQLLGVAGLTATAVFTIPLVYWAGALPFSIGLLLIIGLVNLIGILGAGEIFNFQRKRLEREHKLRAEASIDKLTGLFNRRALEQRADDISQIARAQEKPYSILVADIDRFKQVNDTFGHSAGDKILANVAKSLMASIRGSDVAGRFGGEELVAVLPGCPEREAGEVAERIRKAVERAYTDVEGTSVRVTVSIGVATSSLDIAETYQSVFDRADAALYKAKNQGRNRVVQKEAA